MLAIHGFERGGQQIQVRERGQARLLAYRHRVVNQVLDQLVRLARRDAGKPPDLHAQACARVGQVGARLLANVVIQFQRLLFRQLDDALAVVAGRHAQDCKRRLV